MSELIQNYENNKIWLTLVSYDFSNENHKNFSPLFAHIKNKLENLDINNPMGSFHEWKKAHRFYQFFSNISYIIPNENKKWLETQTNNIWESIASEDIKLFFKKVKATVNNTELNFFFNNIFGKQQKNLIVKEKIVEKLELAEKKFKANTKKSNVFHFVPKAQRYILGDLASSVLVKAQRKALIKGWNGYFFSLDLDTVWKLLAFIPYRQIREEVYKKFISSMQSCEFLQENQVLLNKGLILKKQLANLYGFENYTDLVISKYIITEKQTLALLNESETQIDIMLGQSNTEIEKMFHDDGFTGEMQPWDVSFYQRLYRKKHYLNNDFQKHFLFNQTFPKMLKQIQKIFNVSIKFLNNVNGNYVYHVSDNIDKKEAFWMIQPFKRKKESTPYQVNLADYSHIGANKSIPWIQFIYLNLNKNMQMSFLNVKDTMHEIGHAFHSFFSKNEKMKENFGWDLIELPSQFLENRAYSYDFLKKISSSDYFSKKTFDAEIKNYSFADIFYFKERIIDFKTSFEINKKVNPYSNKKLIKEMTINRHAVGNYYNPFHDTEQFSNRFESDYCSNYVYYFSENIAKNLNLLFTDKEFRGLFKHFDLDKKSFKQFISNKMDVTNINLKKFFNYHQFNK